MYPRSERRWSTRFGRWVRQYGVTRIVADLSSDPMLRVTPNAVYMWLRGHAPHPTRAQALTRLSGGELTIEAIYSHPQELERR